MSVSNRARKASFAAAATLGAAAAVPALAAEGLPAAAIEVQVAARPSRAGTPRRPVGVSIVASATLTHRPDVAGPVLTGVDVLIGKGLRWNGGGFARCARSALDRSGPSGCPKASLMGGSPSGIDDSPDDPSPPPRLTFVNGGPGLVYIWAVITTPARVGAALTLHVRRLTGPGPWGASATVSIPRSLQVVAGIPVTLDAARFTIGGTSYAKKVISSTSCPTGGWRYRVDLHYADASGDATSGAIACS
jgi:hypothetical protein